MTFHTQLATLLVSAGLVVVGLVLGFFISRWMARRQRLHEVKQRAYERLLPIVQDAMSILDDVRSFEEIDISSTDDFEEKIGRLLGFSIYIDENQALAKLMEIGDSTSEQEKEMSDENKRVHIVDAWAFTAGQLISGVAKDVRELNRISATLDFAAPDINVLRKLGAVLKSLKDIIKGWNLRVLVHQAELSADMPEGHLNEILTEMELWPKPQTLRDALEKLKEAMIDDLKRTL